MVPAGPMAANPCSIHAAHEFGKAFGERPTLCRYFLVQPPLFASRANERALQASGFASHPLFSHVRACGFQAHVVGQSWFSHTFKTCFLVPCFAREEFPRRRCHIIGRMTPASSFEVFCGELVFASPRIFTLAASLNVALPVLFQSLFKFERSGNRPFCSYYAAVLAGPGCCTHRHQLHKDAYFMWQSSLDREATRIIYGMSHLMTPSYLLCGAVLAGPRASSQHNSGSLHHPWIVLVILAGYSPCFQSSFTIPRYIHESWLGAGAHLVCPLGPERAPASEPTRLRRGPSSHGDGKRWDGRAFSKLAEVGGRTACGRPPLRA